VRTATASASTRCDASRKPAFSGTPAELPPRESDEPGGIDIVSSVVELTPDGHNVVGFLEASNSHD
jgi:hypothetical protein